MRTIIVIMLAVVAATTARVTTHHDQPDAVSVSVQHRPALAWAERPCAQEDSVNCYWDAKTRGNGHGHSFVNRRMPNGMVCVFYVEPTYATHHDHCAPQGGL